MASVSGAGATDGWGAFGSADGARGIRFGQLKIGDRALGRIAWKGRVVTDSGQARCIDPFASFGAAERDSR